ncbi:MAG TPA: glycoside hydrolase family 3 C-terminal domain-containing protein [Anaerolineaceae bacterium]|nr:glycoside hydrolase family 3 C-terminal domain-containing protein [Anaerolineaceae bacterium]
MSDSSKPEYLDASRPIEERVNDLVASMTLAEKISQMVNDAPAIDRLHVPAYNWWNECLHGVGRAGLATVFPQAIGLAATWNPDLIWRIACVIANEARAKHHQAVKEGKREIYYGLTFWSPNVNIFRDPRWGRGQETYGEDPYLAGQIGKNFVKGLQGDDKYYLKLVATPKHFAVHSGPESDRHQFNAQVSPRDLQQTYLPAFKTCVQEGGARSVMGAYNRTNGEPCCASRTLLEQVLRQEWGFDGYVVSDCGAIDDIYRHHQTVNTSAEAAALGVRSGCDLNCGDTYFSLMEAVAKGLISEAEIDQAVRRLFRARFWLGMFDPEEKVPFASIKYDVVDSPAHRALAVEAACQSIVLLKNEDDFLPLSPNVGSIAVIGSNANNEMVMRGNYFGDPAAPVTILEGIRRRAAKERRVRYARGCGVADLSRAGLDRAVALAARSDLVIAVLGLSQLVEGEETQEEGTLPGQSSQGDRASLDLPGLQQELLERLAATGKPVVLVLLNGSALAVNWAQSSPAVKAILEAWYPGQAGGTAVAQVLFGDTNPAGRLPVTFYQSINQLPPFTDYNMEGHTYRYFRGKPLYPFGYGLSYTQFDYSQAQVEPGIANSPVIVSVSIKVTNTGKVAGDEVVQAYIQDLEASVPVPACELRGFARIHLDPGQSCSLKFDFRFEDLACFDDDGRPFLEPGSFRVWLGGHSPALNGSCVELQPLQQVIFTI